MTIAVDLGRKATKTNKQNIKTCVKRPLLKDQKLVFNTDNTDYYLMQVKSIAECSKAKGSILQYFRPSLCYYLSFRSLFSQFLSGRFTQVLLYLKFSHKKLSPELITSHRIANKFVDNKEVNKLIVGVNNGDLIFWLDFLKIQNAGRVAS